MTNHFYFTALLLFLMDYFVPAYPSAALIIPPSRGMMWTRGFRTPVNYNYMGLNCGGLWNIRGNQGKCGLCGDTFGISRDHEHGGRFATGTIGKAYPKGSKHIEVKVISNAHQKGFFEFRICDASNNPENRACFDKNLLSVVEGRHQGNESRYVPQSAGLTRLNLEIPQGLNCSRCVLQWRYKTGHNWGRDPDGRACVGCGIQEEYINCADIKIVGGTGSPNPTPAQPSNTHRPNTRQKPHHRPIPHVERRFNNDYYERNGDELNGFHDDGPSLYNSYDLNSKKPVEVDEPVPFRNRQNHYRHRPRSRPFRERQGHSRSISMTRDGNSPRSWVQTQAPESRKPSQTHIKPARDTNPTKHVIRLDINVTAPSGTFASHAPEKQMGLSQISKDGELQTKSRTFAAGANNPQQVTDLQIQDIETSINSLSQHLPSVSGSSKISQTPETSPVSRRHKITAGAIKGAQRTANRNETRVKAIQVSGQLETSSSKHRLPVKNDNTASGIHASSNRAITGTVSDSSGVRSKIEKTGIDSSLDGKKTAHDSPLQQATALKNPFVLDPWPTPPGTNAMRKSTKQFIKSIYQPSMAAGSIVKKHSIAGSATSDEPIDRSEQSIVSNIETGSSASFTVRHVATRLDGPPINHERRLQNHMKHSTHDQSMKIKDNRRLSNQHPSARVGPTTENQVIGKERSAVGSPSKVVSSETEGQRLNPQNFPTDQGHAEGIHHDVGHSKDKLITTKHLTEIRSFGQHRLSERGKSVPPKYPKSDVHLLKVNNVPRPQNLPDDSKVNVQLVSKKNPVDNTQLRAKSDKPVENKVSLVRISDSKANSPIVSAPGSRPSNAWADTIPGPPPVESGGGFVSRISSPPPNTDIVNLNVASTQNVAYTTQGHQHGRESFSLPKTTHGSLSHFATISVRSATASETANLSKGQPNLPSSLAGGWGHPFRQNVIKNSSFLKAAERRLRKAQELVTSGKGPASRAQYISVKIDSTGRPIIENSTAEVEQKSKKQATVHPLDTVLDRGKVMSKKGGAGDQWKDAALDNIALYIHRKLQAVSAVQTKQGSSATLAMIKNVLANISMSHSPFQLGQTVSLHENESKVSLNSSPPDPQSNAKQTEQSPKGGGQHKSFQKQTRLETIHQTRSKHGNQHSAKGSDQVSHGEIHPSTVDRASVKAKIVNNAKTKNAQDGESFSRTEELDTRRNSTDMHSKTDAGSETQFKKQIKFPPRALSHTRGKQLEASPGKSEASQKSQVGNMNQHYEGTRHSESGMKNGGEVGLNGRKVLKMGIPSKQVTGRVDMEVLKPNGVQPVPPVSKFMRKGSMSDPGATHGVHRGNGTHKQGGRLGLIMEHLKTDIVTSVERQGNAVDPQEGEMKKKPLHRQPSVDKVSQRFRHDHHFGRKSVQKLHNEHNSQANSREPDNVHSERIHRSDVLQQAPANRGKPHEATTVTGGHGAKHTKHQENTTSIHPREKKVQDVHAVTNKRSSKAHGTNIQSEHVSGEGAHTVHDADKQNSTMHDTNPKESGSHGLHKNVKNGHPVHKESTKSDPHKKRITAQSFTAHNTAAHEQHGLVQSEEKQKERNQHKHSVTHGGKDAPSKGGHQHNGNHDNHAGHGSMNHHGPVVRKRPRVITGHPQSRARILQSMSQKSKQNFTLSTPIVLNDTQLFTERRGGGGDRHSLTNPFNKNPMSGNANLAVMLKKPDTETNGVIRRVLKHIGHGNPEQLRGKKILVIKNLRLSAGNTSQSPRTASSRTPTIFDRIKKMLIERNHRGQINLNNNSSMPGKNPLVVLPLPRQTVMQLIQSLTGGKSLQSG